MSPNETVQGTCPADLLTQDKRDYLIEQAVENIYRHLSTGNRQVGDNPQFDEAFRNLLRSGSLLQRFVDFDKDQEPIWEDPDAVAHFEGGIVRLNQEYYIEKTEEGFPFIFETDRSKNDRLKKFAIAKPVIQTIDGQERIVGWQGQQLPDQE